MIKSILQSLGIISKEINTMPNTPTTPVITPPEPVLSPVQPTPAPISPLLWDTPLNARHSVRVMCDNAGMAIADKNILCACVEQESGFLPGAIGKPNSNGTRDWGICQFNDGKNASGVPFWIGPGAYFTSTDEVLSNPEKCVGEMIAQYKLGHISWWASYTSGEY